MADTRYGILTSPLYRSSKRAKTFAISFDTDSSRTRLQRNSEGALLGPRGRQDLSDPALKAFGRKIFLQELTDLGKLVVEPTYKAYAPEKPGYAKKHLKDEIRARRNLATLSLTVQMPWYGQLTIDGRRALPDKPSGKAYRIELPGGMVIFRSEVGPATRRRWGLPGWDGRTDAHGNPREIQAPPIDPAAARERMRWAYNAYRDLSRGKWFSKYADNIARRFWNDILAPALGSDLSRDDAKLRRQLEANLPDYHPLATQAGIAQHNQAKAASIRRNIARSDARHNYAKVKRLHESGHITDPGARRALARYETRRSRREARAHAYESNVRTLMRRPR